MDLPIRSAFRRSLALLAPAALLIGGCALLDNNDNILPPSHVDFGDAYRILSAPDHPASDVTPPLLQGDSLIVYVQYSGGCAPHDFAFHQRRTDGVIDLWLEHDAHGDLCEALLTRRLARPVENPQNTRVIRLLVPGDAPIVLAEES